MRRDPAVLHGAGGGSAGQRPLPFRRGGNLGTLTAALGPRRLWTSLSPRDSAAALLSLPPPASSGFPRRVSKGLTAHASSRRTRVDSDRLLRAQEGLHQGEAGEVPGAKGKGHSLSGAPLSLQGPKCGTPRLTPAPARGAGCGGQPWVPGGAEFLCMTRGQAPRPWQEGGRGRGDRQDILLCITWN